MLANATQVTSSQKRQRYRKNRKAKNLTKSACGNYCRRMQQWKLNLMVRDNDPVVYITERLTRGNMRGLTGSLSYDTIFTVDDCPFTYKALRDGRYCHTDKEMNTWAVHVLVQHDLTESDEDLSSEERTALLRRMYMDMTLPDEQKYLEETRKKTILDLFGNSSVNTESFDIEFMTGCTCVWLTRRLPSNFKPQLSQDTSIALNRQLLSYEEIKRGHHCYTPAELFKHTCKEMPEEEGDEFSKMIEQEGRERLYRSKEHPPAQKTLEEARQAVLLGLYV